MPVLQIFSPKNWRLRSNWWSSWSHQWCRSCRLVLACFRIVRFLLCHNLSLFQWTAIRYAEGEKFWCNHVEPVSKLESISQCCQWFCWLSQGQVGSWFSYRSGNLSRHRSNNELLNATRTYFRCSCKAIFIEFNACFLSLIDSVVKVQPKLWIDWNDDAFLIYDASKPFLGQIKVKFIKRDSISWIISWCRISVVILCSESCVIGVIGLTKWICASNRSVFKTITTAALIKSPAWAMSLALKSSM